MKKIHWEDLDFHLRRISPPWSEPQYPGWISLLNEVSLHQTGQFPKTDLVSLAPRITSSQESQLLRICLWLLTHGAFYQNPEWSAGIIKILNSVKELASQVSPSLFLKDPERREEIIRLVLSAMNLPIEGETEGESQRRRESLDSLARARILQETRASQQRVQAIREALARKEAEEAASKYTRE